MNINSFTRILLLIFITLKLTGHITWSWWWVFAPLWILIVIAFILLATVFIVERWND